MKDMRIAFLILLFSQLGCLPLVAQDQPQESKEEVTFEEIYDDPYSINKLFIGFQPFYGELFATNINAGFGFEAQYFHKNTFDVKAQFRKTYSSRFYDFNRELAAKNGVTDNKPEIFNYYEVGGTYHIRDFDVYSKTRLVLRKKGTSMSRWASSVPQTAEVPSKVRKIFGARAGAIIWNSTADVTRALEKQGLTNADLVTAENVALPDTYIDDKGETQDLTPFSNLYSTNIYVGGSFTRIRNMAVSFDNYEEGLDDGIFTFFVDVMLAPSLTLDPILYNGEEYYTNAIKLNNLGVRAGIDGKFNRKIAWAYSGELGYRPSMEGRGFFALMKISFPVFSSNLQKKGENSDE
jgi:hypothetical protein